MNRKTAVMIALLSSILCGTTNANVWPNVWGDMKHVMIGVSGGKITAHVEEPALERMEMRRFYGEEYSGSAEVLNNKWYSSQYGWMADGFISIAPDEQIIIENISMSPAMEVYEGGMRMMRDSHSYEAIFGTNGSEAATSWDGMMRHDWFAATSLGEHEASFRVYVADALGNELSSYGDAQLTLLFNAVPAPGTFTLVAITGIAAARRRRQQRTRQEVRHA